MSARIAHRGPDGEGVYLSAVPDGAPHAALAHRRLAIIDPDPRANQPFADNFGRRIVFNGEIYNYRELRQELSHTGEWKTSSDTEVLLRAYATWGIEKCLERLNGMFAFAIWDEGKETLFLARDRMGQKPLYIARAPDNRALAFASEIAALRPVGWIDRTLSQAALAEYLRWGYIPEPSTIRTGIEKLPPGQWLSLDASSVRQQIYFTPTGGPSLDDDAAVSQTRLHVERAVRAQLVSDVPLGCFLSGGVDSSVITAAMRTALGPSAEIHTFSIAFDDPRYDESAYARQVAAHLGTIHHEFHVRPQAAEDLPRLAAVLGEPFADSSILPTHYLAAQTRQHVKVALSGDGGDELFGGYDRYRAMRLAARLRKVPAPWQFLSRGVSSTSARSAKSPLARAKRFIASVGLDATGRYSSYMSIFDEALASELLGRDLRGAGAVNRAFDESLETLQDPVRAALAADRVTYLPGDLLTKVDRASMLHALEVRSPFMDHDLVQFATGLSTPQLLRGGPKRMLREAFATDLPAWVFKRRKMGFAVPIGQWYRTDLRGLLRDSLLAQDSFARAHFRPGVVERLLDEHQNNRTDHSHRLHALLMLELFHQHDR